MSTVFVIDLRVKGTNILKGLMSVLKERRKFYEDMDEGTFKVATAIGSAVGSAVASYLDRAKVFEEVIAIMTALVDKGSEEQPLEVLINELVKRVDGKVTLISDEANLAFEITPGTKDEGVQQQREALSIFTSLTKVQGKV